VKDSARFPASRASGPAAAFYAFPKFPLIFRTAPANRRSQRAARKIPGCFWTKCKSPSCRAKLSAHRAICDYLTPRPLNASRKACGASSVFSLALKPLSDCGVRQPSCRFFSPLILHGQCMTSRESPRPHASAIFSPRIWERVRWRLSFRKIKPARTTRRSVAYGCVARLHQGPSLEKRWEKLGRNAREWRGSNLPPSRRSLSFVKSSFRRIKLSIQVHPDDTYASTHEKAAGGRARRKCACGFRGFRSAGSPRA